MSYSEDVRKIAITQGEKGKRRQVCSFLGVSRTTFYRWKKAETLTPLKTGPKVPYKVDPEALKAHVEAHPDAYQHEIAEAFGVKQSTICVSLKKLKITRKKNGTLPRTKRRTT